MPCFFGFLDHKKTLSTHLIKVGVGALVLADVAHFVGRAQSAEVARLAHCQEIGPQAGARPLPDVANGGGGGQRAVHGSNKIGAVQHQRVQHERARGTRHVRQLQTPPPASAQMADQRALCADHLQLLNH